MNDTTNTGCGGSCGQPKVSEACPTCGTPGGGGICESCAQKNAPKVDQSEEDGSNVCDVKVGPCASGAWHMPKGK